MYYLYVVNQIHTSMPYYTCNNCRSIIDSVLHANALLFANLGSTDSKSAYERAKIEERKNLRSIRKHDPKLIDSLIAESIDDSGK